MRAAKGERLSDAEQAELDAALAQQDAAPLVKTDLDELERLRELAAALGSENAQLRGRVDALEEEARRIERNRP